MIAARILPLDTLLADAARAATPGLPHLVIMRDGQVALVPQLLPGMQKIAVQTDAAAQREAA